MLRPTSLAQKQIPIFRRLVFVVLGAILLSSTPLFTSPVFATNCSSITGGSISDNGANWLLQWDPLPDITGIDYLVIFATSGVGYQDWYNYGDGYIWAQPSASASSYTISKSSLVTFANSINVQNMTFSVRKDNNNAMCYPLTTLGAISLAAAPAAPTLNSVTSGDRRVTISFTAGANNGAAITDYEYSLNGGAYTSAGTTTSPFTITSLSGRTAYSVTIKARNSVGLSTASSSLSATTTDSSLDASEAAAEAARVAAANAEAARVAAANAEAARKAKEQQELTEILAIIPKIAELTLSLGETTKSLYSTKCVKGKTTKFVKKGAKCPKGFLKK
jgi:hypothetical protein